MNKQKKDIRWSVTVALMMAIVILLANTPLGMIQLPIVKATTVHIPVIIGSIVLGPLAGICTVVAFTIGNCIIPSGVFANKMTIAIINATVTVQRVSFFCLFIFHVLLVIAPL